eukprot:6237046-Ditylum_brightwellii.AAC.1
MQKAAKGNGDIRKDAEVTGQGLLLDWGFMVQKSKNQDKVEKLTTYWPQCISSNSPEERSHGTIGGAIRSMLEGSRLPEKCWNHVLYCYAEMHSYLPHRRRDKTSHEIVTGN